MKKTNEQFLKELKEVNPNINPLEEYNGANTKIKVECKKCRHKWDTTPSNLVNGKYGCPNCAGRCNRGLQGRGFDGFPRFLQYRQLRGYDFVCGKRRHPPDECPRIP